MIHRSIRGGGPELKKISLNIDNKLEIPCNIGVIDVDYFHHPEKPMRESFLLPFGPDEEGYPIDSEDFDLETRMKKRERLGEKFLHTSIDTRKNPFQLAIGASLRDLEELGLNTARETEGGKFELSAEELDLLKRLRVLVMTPRGRFEARTLDGDLSAWSKGEPEGLDFLEYYPVDFGSLASGEIPVPGGIYAPGEGFLLGLPNDPEKLAQIRVKFVLAEEEPRGEN